MSYGKVHDVFWDDDRIESLSDRAALLALFLITGPHRNAIGCFRLGTGAISDLPRFGAWGIEGVSVALRELSNAGFIVRDDRTGWTFIVNALKHDPIKGSKAAIHALGLAIRVPKKSAVYVTLFNRLMPQLQREETALSDKPGWPLEDPRNTPSEGDAIPKPSPSPLPEPSPEPSTADAVAAPDGASPPDLKTAIWGPCLDWLVKATRKAESTTRGAIGRWIRDYGEGPVLEAMMAAQRQSPVDPVAYIEKLLKTGGPRDGPHSQERRAALEAQVDEMVSQAAEAADRSADDQHEQADNGPAREAEFGFRAPDAEDDQRRTKPEVRGSGGGLRRISSALPSVGTGGGR